MNDFRAQIATLKDVLDAADPRPLDVAVNPADEYRLAKQKRLYEMRFADKMAICLANGLRDRFPGVLPDQVGKGSQPPYQRVRGPKKLDVNYSTPQLGLGFGISIKAAHFKEEPRRGYIHGRELYDDEFRLQAIRYHQRQPYAVMIAVLFLPDEACDDATSLHPSSFGEWVRYLRPLSKRVSARDGIDLYERIFIGLYRKDGTNMEFFDVANKPPRRGRPTNLLSWGALREEIEKSFLRRDLAEFEWADDSADLARAAV